MDWGNAFVIMISAAIVAYAVREEGKRAAEQREGLFHTLQKATDRLALLEIELRGLRGQLPPGPSVKDMLADLTTTASQPSQTPHQS